MQIELEQNIFFELLTKSTTRTSNQTPIIFLHGFTGKANDWEFLFEYFSNEYYPIAIDFNYHIKDETNKTNFKFDLNNLNKLLNKTFDLFHFDKAFLVGYSMGGRIALTFANSYPEKIKGLVLESSSPGITNQIDRENRYISDNELANDLIKNGTDVFLDFWYSQSMFNSLFSYKNELIKNKSSLCKYKLANILTNFSTGIMPPLWDSLNKFNFPILLITGELDTKFTKINIEMQNLLPLSEHKIISNAGHNVHLEKNIDFTILVMDFINNL